MLSHRRPHKASAQVLWTLACLGLVGCGGFELAEPPSERTDPVDEAVFELLARFVHISDSQIVDEESPGRLTVAAHLIPPAWRPHEAYATQLLDGFVRTVNKLHISRHRIDFVVHTGDAVDNVQQNELDWFVTLMDGGLIDPLTGPDDRVPQDRPSPLMDPHEPFAAQGLYRQGVHGPLSTIAWYVVMGNHDHFASGVFPIVDTPGGNRVSPMLLQNRVGLFLPVNVDPAGSLSWGPVSPASPGPPPELNIATTIEPDPDRRFFDNWEFVQALLASSGEPPGHGFAQGSAAHGSYSVSPAAGVRLIGLNSASQRIEYPGLPFPEGGISGAQVRFLREELESALRRGESVIVATHHPSAALKVDFGSAIDADAFRSILRQYPCVKLHLAGHTHRNDVADRGSYLEVQTGSTLDSPQLGRIIEVWGQGDAVELRYWFFSHLDEIEGADPAHEAITDDPLAPMRRIASDLAESDRASGGLP